MWKCTLAYKNEDFISDVQLEDGNSEDEDGSDYEDDGESSVSDKDQLPLIEILK